MNVWPILTELRKTNNSGTYHKIKQSNYEILPSFITILNYAQFFSVTRKI